MPDPFEIPLKNMQAAIDAAMPVIEAKAGQIGLEFFNENFQLQGFQGSAGFEPWKFRESGKDTGRAILVKSGHLRAGNRIESSSTTEIVFGNSVPYAQIHNEGGTIHHPGGQRTLSFRKTRQGNFRFNKDGGKYKTIAQARVNINGYDIHMPKRPFMAHSNVMDNRIEKMIVQTLINAFK
jgi:phage gpG-like protein